MDLYEKMKKVINSFKDSEAKYLITSDYTSCKTNKDQKTSGAWRPVNLQIAPFNFPYPIDTFTSKDAIMTLYVMNTIPRI